MIDINKTAVFVLNQLVLTAPIDTKVVGAKVMIVAILGVSKTFGAQALVVGSTKVPIVARVKILLVNACKSRKTDVIGTDILVIAPEGDGCTGSLYATVTQRTGIAIGAFRFIREN